MASVCVIMIGDVVGDPGLDVLEKRLPELKADCGAHLVVVNGENAAGGFGLTEESLARILLAGADVVTGGNHIWEKREFWPVLESGKPVLRPANYPQDGSPQGGVSGRGWLVLEKQLDGQNISFLVINLQGRKRMTAIDCPFRCFDAILAETRESGGGGTAAPARPLVVVDFHAESTEEKESLGYYLDGRAALVAGTHTHVQTTDERILPNGTAYITDLGMTGALNGVIGMDAGICINRARSQIAYRMECARPESETDCAVQGIIAELDRESGRALGIRRIRG
ncbi:MAG: YmdB family metallophosphoesterase [Treponema sp.]|jgi:metallophosphoesterase (TIGR00282 family)|nr:YmdB family metallophosphoesterase [Treponema sp.]